MVSEVVGLRRIPFYCCRHPPSLFSSDTFNHWLPIFKTGKTSNFLKIKIQLSIFKTFFYCILIFALFFMSLKGWCFFLTPATYIYHQGLIMLCVYIFSNGNTILCYYRIQSLWKWTEKSISKKENLSKNKV